MNGRGQRIYVLIKEIFSVDLRSLALLRISIASLVLYDIVTRAGDLTAHYTDAGVLPRYLFDESTRILTSSFSINQISGEWWVQVIIFLAAAFSALALLTGYKTRFFTILAWLFLTSIQNRNVLLNYGADDLLRIILFWGIFLPWGKRFSLDSYSNTLADVKRQSYSSVTTAGYFIQIMLVYWYAFFAKTGPEWREEFSAIYYVFSIDQLVYPLGKFFYQFPGVMKGLTIGTLALEFIGPFLLLLSFKNGPFRCVVVFMFIFFHLVMGFSFFLGLFPWVGALVMVGMLPKCFWETSGQLIIKAKLISVMEKYGKFLFEKLNSLPSFNKYLKLNLPARRIKKSLIINIAASFLLIFIIMSTIDSFVTVSLVPGKIHSAGLFIRLKQQWSYFAPSPYTDDGWYVFQARLSDGTELDLFKNGEPLDWNKPEWISRSFQNHRWANFISLVGYFPEVLETYSEFLCREWNESNTEQKHVQTLQLIYMQELTLPDYKTEPVEKVLWISHSCEQ